MSAALLTVESVDCQRGGLTILSGVSFSLNAGEAVVLRGPNGSGKTTLLRTIAGLQPPAAGSIDGDPDDIAYTGHADGVKATLTVRENLAFWAGVFGRNEIAGALDAFDLGDLTHRPAGALSAGQRRRLSLARLAVTGRRIWLLDEPTVSLDTASVARFGAAVSAHLAAGGAAIMATHIDLGLPSERTLDVSQFKAKPEVADQHEAFL